MEKYEGGGAGATNSSGPGTGGGSSLSSTVALGSSYGRARHSLHQLFRMGGWVGGCRYHAGGSGGEDLQVSESSSHEADGRGQSVESTESKQNLLKDKKTPREDRARLSPRVEPELTSDMDAKEHLVYFNDPLTGLEGGEAGWCFQIQVKEKKPEDDCDNWCFRIRRP